MTRLAVIAPLSTIARRARLKKMMPVLEAKRLAPVFYGWERVKGEARDDNQTVEERIILRGGGNNTWQARLMYPLWMLAVFLLALRLGRRTDLFCLGWETAFPALIASRLTGARVIFDDADRFSLIVQRQRAIQRAEQYITADARSQLFLHTLNFSDAR